jgi:hypothetical protein
MPTPDEKKRRRSGLTGAALFLPLALLLFHMGRQAELRHTFIPESYKHGWMTPQQAYVGAFLCLALAAYAIFLGFRRS